MGTAQLLRLLPSVPVVTPPDVSQQISAGSAPTWGNWTTQLLDPAQPASGAAQQIRTVATPTMTNGTWLLVFGRWITRSLPAQTIAIGNWTFYGVQRRSVTLGGGLTYTVNVWGFTVAQWRPGTGVIARAVDSPTGGTGDSISGATADRPNTTTIAGSALTLLAGDCLVLELWSQVVTNGSSTANTFSLLSNGYGQYVPGIYATGTYTDTDAYLKAPALITFS